MEEQKFSTAFPWLALSHSHCEIFQAPISSHKVRTTENLCSKFSPLSPLEFTMKSHGNTSFVKAYCYKAEILGLVRPERVSFFFFPHD